MEPGSGFCVCIQWSIRVECCAIHLRPSSSRLSSLPDFSAVRRLTNTSCGNGR